MKLIKVKKQYHDKELKKTFKPGDTYEVSDKRAELIDKALPGFIDIKEAPKPKRVVKAAEPEEKE